MNIDEQISDIGKQVSRLTTILEQDAQNRKEFRDRIEGLIEKHQEALYGNVPPGVFTRLTELETSHKNQASNKKLVWAAILALAVKIVYDWLTLISKTRIL